MNNNNPHFTFATLTYNHENFILEHLESIKFQILAFGKNHFNHFILCDDYSSDNTVKIVKMWLISNFYLFNTYKIIKSNINKGINQNFIKCFRNIKTKNFKILAGDDLYYKNCIYSVNLNTDLTFSPLIYYDGIKVHDTSKIDRILLIKSNFMYSRLLLVSNLFNAPGTFIKAHLLDDSNLINELTKYTYLEDYPTWYYLFNRHKHLKVNIHYYPLVLYRKTSGISANTNNSLSKAYEFDILSFKRRHKLPISKLEKYTNIYYYISFFISLYLKYCSFFHPSKLRISSEIVKEELNIATDYVLKIKASCKSFIEKNSLR